MIVLLATKDDPPFGPYVDIGLSVSTDQWVGVSIPSDTGDLSITSYALTFVRSGKGGVQNQRGIIGVEDMAKGHIKLQVAAPGVQPKTTGRIDNDSKVLHLGVYHPAKGKTKASRGVSGKSTTLPKGYHVVSRGVSGVKGYDSSQ